MKTIKALLIVSVLGLTSSCVNENIAPQATAGVTENKTLATDKEVLMISRTPQQDPTTVK